MDTLLKINTDGNVIDNILDLLSEARCKEIINTLYKIIVDCYKGTSERHIKMGLSFVSSYIKYSKFDGLAYPSYIDYSGKNIVSITRKHYNTGCIAMTCNIKFDLSKDCVELSFRNCDNPYCVVFCSGGNNQEEDTPEADFKKAQDKKIKK